MRLAPILLLVPALAPLSGCCSLARFFCGPDRTKWVSVDYTTPELATQTFLEALRRDSPEEVYHCLSQGFRQRNQLTKFVTEVVWDKVREQAPGLHVAGYAEVPVATLSADGSRAHVTLDVEGRRLDVDLVCERKWEVRYRRPDGVPPGEKGDYVRSADQVVRVTTADDAQRSTVELTPFIVPHQGIDDLHPADIEFAGFVSEWKIEKLEMPGEQPAH